MYFSFFANSSLLEPYVSPMLSDPSVHIAATRLPAAASRIGAAYELTVKLFVNCTSSESAAVSNDRKLYAMLLFDWAL